MTQGLRLNFEAKITNGTTTKVPLVAFAWAQPAIVFIDDTFEDFAAGTLDAGGQNLYVSRDGKVRTIHRFDLNGDGHLDLRARQGLLTPRTALLWIASWLLLASILFGLLAWVVPAEFASLGYIAFGVLLMLPTVRLAGTPLALAWNRHR